MSVDFPRGWEITRATEPEYHHNHCSYNTAGMLCDCDILMRHPELLDKATFYGAGGRVIEPRASPAEAARPAQTEQQPVTAHTLGGSAEFSQFLSAVMDAAGLVRHGKRSKELSEYLGAQCLKYRQVAQTAPKQAELDEVRLLLRETAAVAITMLFSSHKADVLAAFTAPELEAVVQASAHLQAETVEHVYRRAWLATHLNPQEGESQ